MDPTLKALLAKLHVATAEELLARVKSGDAKPADLAVAVKFLKDNGIDGVPKDGSPVSELAKHVPFPAGDDQDDDTSYAH